MTYKLSATKLVTYKQCPQAYSFRYERGISAPGAFGSPDLGNALHQALAIAYRDWHYNDHKPEWDWFETCWGACRPSSSNGTENNAKAVTHTDTGFQRSIFRAFGLVKLYNPFTV